MSIEETFKKRFQARRFLKDKIPDKELIKSLLEKTFELVPSKQSLVPYNVWVLGPEHLETKQKLHNLASWHWQKNKEGRVHNGTIQLLAPYLIIFTDRQVNDPSPAIVRNIQRGHPYPILELGNEQVNKALEVGMFSKILTGLCLEKDLAVSYTLCFPTNKEKQKSTVPELIDIIESHVLLLMSIGYPAGENFIREFNEYKPPIENVIKWI
jgi:hypothetical protein|tara:strand:- start:403 stop:1035 length:633 start_codon:yes stop_codon:yes gene_type:complete